VSDRRDDFHGVRHHVDTDDDAIGEAIDARLRHFRAAGEAEPDVRHEVRIAARHAIRRPDGEGRPVYDPPEGDTERVLTVSLGGSERRMTFRRFDPNGYMYRSDPFVPGDAR
jgi:hypothetical protein